MKYILLFIFILYITKGSAERCDIARHKAMQSNLIGGYIPQCDGNPTKIGKKYAIFQCHHSAFYCFCADEISGAPVSENFQPMERKEMAKKCIEIKRKKEKFQKALRI